jgi:hypothetical protein
MERLRTLFFGLMPLCIGLFAIGLLTGRLVIREKDGNKREISGRFRVNLWFVAVMSTTAGLLCIAAALGLFPARIN